MSGSWEESMAAWAFGHDLHRSAGGTERSCGGDFHDACYVDLGEDGCWVKLAELHGMRLHVSTPGGKPARIVSKVTSAHLRAHPYGTVFRNRPPAGLRFHDLRHAHLPGRP